MSAEKPHQKNSGVLYPNGKGWIAEKPGRPDKGGEATIECPHCKAEARMRVAAWEKTGSVSGRPLLSLSFSFPNAKGAK